MDENGGVDSGVITSIDMLSFARQVAMAMVSYDFKIIFEKHQKF